MLNSVTTLRSRGSDVEYNRSDPIAELVSAIESYVRTHPDASDSLSGIRDWWLKKMLRPAGTVLAPGEVGEALERLVEAAVLERVELPGGECIFRTRRDGNVVGPALKLADDKR